MKHYKKLYFPGWALGLSLAFMALAVPAAWGQNSGDRNSSSNVITPSGQQGQNDKALSPDADAVTPSNAADQTTRARSSSGENSNGVENIVVTAQKRKQVNTDVPIALDVVKGDFLTEQGITGFSDLSSFVPNAKFQTNVPTGINLNIRGFTKQSGNPAFEQAVGLVVDGVPYEDNAYFITGLYDVKRVSVLRGPQGTLQGANSTAGLLNVTTRDPTSHAQGFINVQGGEYGKRRVEGGIGGSLIPGELNYRLAGVTDQIGGAIDNTTEPNNSALSHDRAGIRLKLQAPDFMGSTWGLTLERDKAAFVGTGQEITSIDDNSADYLRQYDPKLDIKPDNYKASIKNPTRTNRNIQKAVGTWSNDFSGWNLKFIAGFGRVLSSLGIANGTPTSFSRTNLGADKKQYSAEFVANSPRLFGGALDFTGGLFYLHRSLDLDSRLGINDGIVVGLDTANQGGAVLPPPGPGATKEVSTIFFNQKSDTIASYGQSNWHFADKWTATFGLRLSEVFQNASIQRRFDTASAPLLKSVLGYRAFNTDQSRREFDAQPKFALNYKPIDGVSLFFTYARGFRNGGFNAAAPNNINGLTYHREGVNDYEIIAKTQPLQNLTLSVDFYRMDLNQFQTLTTPPTKSGVTTQGGVVVNAGGARAQGIEASTTWLPTDWLTVRTAAAYNNARFTSFKIGPCATNRQNTDGDGDPRCDRSGDRLPFAPILTASLSPTVHYPIAHGLVLQGGLSVFYNSAQTTGIPGDDRFRQGQYYKFNGFVGVANPQQGWSVKLVGKNLTDRATNRKTAQIRTTDIMTQDLEAPRVIYGVVSFHYQ